MTKILDSVKVLQESLSMDPDESVQEAWTSVKPILTSASDVAEAKGKQQAVAMDALMSAIKKANRKRRETTT